VSLTSSNSQPAVVAYGAATASGGAPPVVVSCTPPSQTVFPIGPTTVTCTAADARQRTSSCTFGITVLTPPTINLTRFAAFGDSMTRGEDGSGSDSAFGTGVRQRPLVVLPDAQTYPGVLRQLLATRYTAQSIVVDNQGNPGELANDPATRSRFSGVVAGGRYQAVLIMEGANDLANRDDRVTDAVIASLRTMINDARSRNVRPYLATIPPQVPGGRRALAWSLIAPFDDKIRALAASESVTLVDVYQAIAANTTQYINDDGEHLTPAGYAKIADTFFATLKDTLERPPAVTLTLSRPQAAGGASRR
jgi:lysophospholipase L1-like esterase